ncbi:hypothetical protein ACTMS0_06670 [Micromonospora sp. H33]|uniref:hypothetical protein n=1 Tax=Micromonospora sp. H33 TaxID=3452215 RepID=UPI003F8C3B1F
MTGTWIAITVAGFVLLGTTLVTATHRRRVARLAPLDRARLAARGLRRGDRTRRGRGRRGGGDHFGRTKIRKYGDEHHDGNTGSGGGDSGGGDSGGGSSW